MKPVICNPADYCAFRHTNLYVIPEGYVVVPKDKHITLQSCRDGLWAHFEVGDKHFAYNLDCDDMARPFCSAYRAMLAATPEVPK